MPRALRFSFVKGEWISWCFILLPRPFNPSLSLLVSLSFLLHSRSKGMIFDASKSGLPWFPFPPVGLISAMIVIFFVACDCLKCLVFKGFACWQA